jgi:hypothetical protein
MSSFHLALLIAWIVHSIATVSCSSHWFYHWIYLLTTQWHILARSLQPLSRTYLSRALMSWWDLSQKDRTMASCRAVMRLLEFSSTQNKVYMTKRPEVRVTTEHITMAEFPYVMLHHYSESVDNSLTHLPYSINHSHRTSFIYLQSMQDQEAQSVKKDTKKSLEFPGTPV